MKNVIRRVTNLTFNNLSDFNGPNHDFHTNIIKQFQQNRYVYT